MTSRKIQKEQRRTQLLHVALEEFIEKGFYGTSTNEIAKRCNISTGLVFHYFESKEDLYLTILKEASAGLNHMLAEIPENIDPLQMFLNIAAYTLDMFQQSPESLKTFVFIKQAMFVKLSFPEADAVINSMNPIEVMVAAVKKGQQLGKITDGDPLAITTLFFSSLQGVGEMIYKYPHLPLPEPEWFITYMRRL